MPIIKRFINREAGRQAKLSQDDRDELEGRVREQYPDAGTVNVTYYDNEIFAEVWREWPDGHYARVISLGALGEYA